ncbi:MAG: preprotein translocase subunit SecA [Kineosporiaceae bacterium]
MKILERVLRAGEGRILKRLVRVADQVNLLEDDIRALSDAELREETDRFRARLADGESLDDLTVEAFAVVREAARRTLGFRHFDVQIMGAAALHLGNIAEMKTGEGKTLVATAPAYLNALAGQGVHVVTVNDYLAEYQSDLMGRVYRFLGLTTGVILSRMTPAERREAYRCDITYGTNNEFGFDYLRDNMATDTANLVQRGHHFAVVDEVDSILIDEARTPLIISGPVEQQQKWYEEFARLAGRMERDAHYDVDEKKRTIGVNEAGIELVEDHLGIDNLYDPHNTPLIGFMNNAVKAKELYRRDKEYVVVESQVLIVDEHTGRVLSGRRYSDGMHQAIEAKERVPIQRENQTLATITLQNYFRLYDKLSGMTGTAQTEAAEFQQIYGLGVVPIPTNMPMVRVDQPDLVYKTEEAKFAAVVEDIAERNAEGQPILVGTTSVEKSEHLSRLLQKRGIRHEVLNAKQHEREATIVARAGLSGSVTVATNMAGRGTDIMLGGNAEFLAVEEMRARGLDPVEDAEEYEATWSQVLAETEERVAKDRESVVKASGLYVLGTERHESRRIDNQLRGRSGRQGDPGESRFYLSLTDDLMRMFNAGLVESFLNAARIPDDVPIESKMVSRQILSAQTQVESRNFEIRKNVLKYDDVLNKQRTVIYAERRQVLEHVELGQQMRQFATDTVEAIVSTGTAEGHSEDWDLDALWDELRQVYAPGVTLDDLVEEAGGQNGLDGRRLVETFTEDVLARYDEREAELGEETMRTLERRVVLGVLDRKWREHLYEMDYLKEGIGLRAMAQRDPLVEYQREGYQLFQAMVEGLKEESVRLVFAAQVRPVTDGGTEAATADGPSALAVGAAPVAASTVLAGGGTATGRRAAAQSPAATIDDGTLDTRRGAGADGGDPRISVPGLADERVGALQYSAPTLDPENPVERTSTGGRRAARSAAGEPGSAGQGAANRAQRRAAEKRSRKQS